MLRIKRTHGRPRERGQALVETALGMMVLLALLAGMVDFGLAFGYRVALTNASRSGARYASRYPKLRTNIDQTIVEALRGTLVLAQDFDEENTITGEGVTGAAVDERLSIVVVCQNGAGAIACTSAARGDQVQVTVTYDYAPVFGQLLGIEDLPVGSSTIMYVLGPDEL